MAHEEEVARTAAPVFLNEDREEWKSSGTLQTLHHNQRNIFSDGLKFFFKLTRGGAALSQCNFLLKS
jgi:hypothetical protein